MIGPAMMVRIEARRRPALLFLPLLIAASWWITSRDLPEGIALWEAASEAPRRALGYVGPLAAGLAAWVATRDRRQRMDELLATTPRLGETRDLAAWAGGTFWVALAYAAVAASVLALTVPKAP